MMSAYGEITFTPANVIVFKNLGKVYLYLYKNKPC